MRDSMQAPLPGEPLYDGWHGQLRREATKNRTSTGFYAATQHDFPRPDATIYDINP